MKTAKDFSESDSIVGGRPSLREGRPPKRPFEKTNIRSIQLHLQIAPKHSFRAEIYSSNKNLWVAPHYTSIQKHNRSLTRLCRMTGSTASFSVKTAKDFSESDSIVGGDLRFSGGRPRCPFRRNKQSFRDVSEADEDKNIYSIFASATSYFLRLKYFTNRFFCDKMKYTIGSLYT